MAELANISDYLNNVLQVADFEDSSLNGLQVQGPEEIKKIGFAVDACLATFKKATKEECQLLIVHHGILWGDKRRALTGQHFKRIQALISGGVGLYAAHLPLDAHQRYGNNAELARILGVKNLKPFGIYKGGKFLGLMGKLKRQGTLNEIAQLLNATLRAECIIHPFGRKEDEKVATIGIIAGFGSICVPEATQRGLDLFLTGEFPHSSFHVAKEAGLSVIAAGHYTTETLGLRALMPLLEKRFKVETVFLDEPTGL